MIIDIVGHAVTSARYEVKHPAVSWLIINTEDRWVWPQTACYPDRLEFHYHSEATQDTIGVLTLYAESPKDVEVLDRLRYTSHNKDQLEIMFLNEDKL